MSPYAALLATRYRVTLQYRAAAAAGVFTQLFFGLVIVMVLEAFYASSEAAPPLPLPAAISYVWLGQAFFALLPWQPDPEVEDQIRRGHVAYELLRPLDLYALWSARTLAARASRVTLRALPIAVLAGGVLPAAGLESWRLAPPVSAGAAAAWALALAVAALLGTALTMILHASMLFTLSGRGVAAVMPVLVSVLSGMVIPLPLFPAWAQPWLRALPFRGLVDVPHRIYTGHLPVAEGLGELALLVGWTALLVAAGRLLLARGLRQLPVQGG